MADPVRSDQVRRGWQDRKRRIRHAGDCAECGRWAEARYGGPPRHERDLCIDCAESFAREHPFLRDADGRLIVEVRRG